jgi:hypothetical protein
VEARSGKIVESDLISVRNERLIPHKQLTSPRDPRVEGVVFSASGDRGHICPLCGVGQLYRMAEEVGILRHSPGVGRAGKRAPAKLPRSADDPSHLAVTPEALEVARYITDMTAQLGAMAIAARLDLLAHFLRIASAEGEILVRVNDLLESERVEDRPYEPAVGPSADET